MKPRPSTVHDVVNQLAQAMMEGRLDERGDTKDLRGQDAALIDTINQMLDTLITPMRVASGALDEIAHGRIPPFIIHEQQGEYDKIKRSINTLLAVLYGMHSEILNLTDSVREGRLLTRGNDWDYEGIWQELISGMNKTLDAVVDPLHEASAVLGQLAAYDLRARMHGKYRGQHAIIRDAMNATAATLHDAISQVHGIVELLSSVGRSVVQSSSAVAEGAKEQSLRLADATGTLDMVAEHARSSAKHTLDTQANAQLAASAVTTAKHSTERMLVAMSEICTSAERTASIVSQIDAISKETGNLSNSASDKAQRMGRSAGGFKVVAQEIRQLSGRCLSSAKSMGALEKILSSGMDASARQSMRGIIDDMTSVAIFSNLLGINAAIEAAHVVGAGTDFSKLTEEIRSLAVRSAEAARSTETLIKTAVVQARSGVGLSAEIDHQLAAAASGADAISHLTNEISRATAEQAGYIGDINDLVSCIHQITSTNSASAAESLDAASRLNVQMQQLSDLVQNFKV